MCSCIPGSSGGMCGGEPRTAAAGLAKKCKTTHTTAFDQRLAPKSPLAMLVASSPEAVDTATGRHRGGRSRVLLISPPATLGGSADAPAPNIGTGPSSVAPSPGTPPSALGSVCALPQRPSWSSGDYSALRANLAWLPWSASRGAEVTSDAQMVAVPPAAPTPVPPSPEAPATTGMRRSREPQANIPVRQRRSTEPLNFGWGSALGAAAEQRPSWSSGDYSALRANLAWLPWSASRGADVPSDAQMVAVALTARADGDRGASDARMLAVALTTPRPVPPTPEAPATTGMRRSREPQASNPVRQRRSTEPLNLGEGSALRAAAERLRMQAGVFHSFGGSDAERESGSGEGGIRGSAPSPTVILPTGIPAGTPGSSRAVTAGAAVLDFTAVTAGEAVLDFTAGRGTETDDGESGREYEVEVTEHVVGDEEGDGDMFTPGSNTEGGELVRPDPQLLSQMARLQMVINLTRRAPFLFELIEAMALDSFDGSVEAGELTQAVGRSIGMQLFRPSDDGPRGVPAYTIDMALPALLFSEAQEFLRESDRDVECAVCLCERLPDDAVRVLPCVHCFHVNCIDNWLYRNNSCPCCKATAVEEDR